MLRDAKITRSVPLLIDRSALQPADGASLALRVYQLVAIEGLMPGGERNRVVIAEVSTPPVEATQPLCEVDATLQGYRLISGTFRIVED